MTKNTPENIVKKLPELNCMERMFDTDMGVRIPFRASVKNLSPGEWSVDLMVRWCIECQEYHPIFDFLVVLTTGKLNGRPYFFLEGIEDRLDPGFGKCYRHFRNIVLPLKDYKKMYLKIRKLRYDTGWLLRFWDFKANRPMAQDEMGWRLDRHQEGPLKGQPKAILTQPYRDRSGKKKAEK